MTALFASVSFQIPLPPLAHQGGWDEILMVAGPLAIIGGMLWLANRRMTAQLKSEPEGDKPAK